MTNLSPLLDAHFGVVRTRHLLRAGLSHHHIAALADKQHLKRIRRGWWSAPAAHPDVVSAVRAGGVLTGPSALRLRGLWTPPGSLIHVRAFHSDEVRPTSGMQVHRLPDAHTADCLNSCDDVHVSMLVTMRDASMRDATILSDAAVNGGHLSRLELEAVAEKAGEKGAEVLKHFDPRADSGTESILRMWLQAHRIQFEPQVVIPGVGRVDFRIGKSLIIEVDSRAHHSDPSAYANDRRRDLLLVVAGYRVLRVTYEQVMFGLEELGQSILRLIREQAHMQPLFARGVAPLRNRGS